MAYHLPACERIVIKLDSIKSRGAMGPENILFAGMFMHFSVWNFYRLGQ